MHKLLKTIIAASTICSALFAASAVHAEFSDMPSDPATASALTNAVSNGLLNGVSDTEIAPDAALTRAQMGTILSRAMGATKTADISKFTDMNGHWAYEDMQKAVAMGAFEGDGNQLSPDAQITTEQAYTVLSRIFCLKYTDANALAGCSDAASVSSWAKDHVIKIYTSGYECNPSAVNPQKAMTRAEFAVVMDKLVKTYINEPGTYNTLPSGNVVIRAQGVVLENCTTSDDVYIADCVTGDTTIKGGDVERIVVRGGNCVVSGTVGNVYAAVSGTSITPIQPYTVKDPAKDGKKGYLDASVDGTYINLGMISM
ncbi:MAG: S-layer homology domain-containing protein [Clostridiales bacterium]|nr:S-layer homology domain-containing protein [Clostridiales bacterium]